MSVRLSSVLIASSAIGMQFVRNPHSQITEHLCRCFGAQAAGFTFHSKYVQRIKVEMVIFKADHLIILRFVYLFHPG